MHKTVLRAEHLKAFYVLDVFGTRKVIRAVDGVDLEAHENEVYGIAGESGCGKTTLLKVLYGAVEPPLRLMEGRVWYRVDGEELDSSALSPEALRSLRWEYISYVPQGSMSVLNPVIKVKETFRDYLESHVAAASREQTLELAKRHLSALGLPLTVLEAYPHQL